MSTTKQEQVFRQVTAEAWQDDAYKQELLENPVAAIEKLTGEKVDLPEGKKLVVTDQSDPDTLYFNLPVKPDINETALTEEQLEAIAGGACSLIFIPIPKFPIPIPIIV